MANAQQYSAFNSVPLLIIPEMLLMGFIFTSVDFLRKHGLDNAMRRDEMYELSQLMRKSK